MNPLATGLAARIRREGPLTVEEWWGAALFDPAHGYYSAAEPFGRMGDFTTAPEISQMFGELLGAWAAAAWRGLGRPKPFVLAEIGGGRGTLMADLLRALRQVDPSCLKAARVRLVETSDRLAALQLAAIERFDLPARRLRRLEEAEALPFVVLANELFDALPIRQLAFDGARWRERRVGLDEDGARLRFVDGEVAAPAPRLDPRPGGLPAPEAGSVLEWSPARLAMAASIAARLSRTGGAGLFVDYGFYGPAYGDTLQAVRAHRFADPLERPGEADITSHVDFAALGHVFTAAGLPVAPPARQGEFLLSLGLLERAGALGAGRPPADQEAIRSAVHRLAGDGETAMGSLFKVLAVSSRPLDLPPFAPAPRRD